MESNAKKIMIAAFAVLFIAVIVCMFFVYKPLWNDVSGHMEKSVNNLKTFNAIKSMQNIMLVNSKAQSPSPAIAAQNNLRKAREEAKEVLEEIKSSDEEFESFFMRSRREVTSEMGFRTIYEQRVEGFLRPLLRDKGVYNPGEDSKVYSISVIESLSDKPGLCEFSQKALQKQAWIYQRIIYSLLKNSSDGTPLVRELILPPDAASTQKAAIIISYCEKVDEERKADKKNAGGEPIFYGGDKIEQITVSLAVLLDERHLMEFLEEMRAYNSARGFRDNVTGGDIDDMKEVGKVKPIVFDIQSMTVGRLSPSEDYTVPDFEQTVEGTNRKDAAEKIKQVGRLVKVELVLAVLDYNPYYKAK